MRRMTSPCSPPPFRTSKVPLVAVFGSPGTDFKSMGFHADLPLPRGWPNTKTDGSSACNLDCSARAERWNNPHDLQAKMTTALFGTLSYTATSDPSISSLLVDGVGLVDSFPVPFS